MTALSCSDVAAHIMAAGVPVLLLDTCLVLDIVRAPVREPITVHDIAAVHTISVRASQSPPALTLVVDEQVLREFQEHIDDVESETVRDLKKIGESVSGVLDRIAALDPGQTVPNSVDLLSLGFPARGRRLGEVILQSSLVLEDHGDEVVKAFSRVNSVVPPATRAKQSVKDCVIIESYLRLAEALQSAGFSRKRVFATSNTKDYQQGESSLHSALRSEFNAAGLEYSPNWSAARHELDRQ